MLDLLGSAAHDHSWPSWSVSLTSALDLTSVSRENVSTILAVLRSKKSMPEMEDHGIEATTELGSDCASRHILERR